MYAISFKAVKQFEECVNANEFFFITNNNNNNNACNLYNPSFSLPFLFLLTDSLSLAPRTWRPPTTSRPQRANRRLQPLPPQPAKRQLQLSRPQRVDRRLQLSRFQRVGRRPQRSWRQRVIRWLQLLRRQWVKGRHWSPPVVVPVLFPRVSST